MRKTLHQTFTNRKFIKAAAEGRIQELSKLLCNGAQIDAIEQGETALIAATVNSQAEAVRALIGLGAGVDATDALCNTALSHALHHRLFGIARLLVQFGADLDHRTRWGDTPLTVAARMQDQPFVEAMIGMQADVNVTNSMGQSALLLANNHLPIVRSLLLAKADPAHAANTHAVLNAVLGRKTDVAALLMFAGAQPNAVDGTGIATLTYAVNQGDLSLVRCLIVSGADPNQGANQQALADALALPNAEVLQALLDAGARPDVCEQAGQNAVTVAFARGNAHAVAYWFPAGSVPAEKGTTDHGWNPMALAIETGTPEIVAILRDAGFATGDSNPQGHDLLMLACHRGLPDMVSGLLQPRNGRPGADPDARAHGDGKTALMFAAAAGRTDAIKILLAAGANPHAVDAMRRTAMNHAEDCADADQRNAMEFMLAEAMAARALEAAGQPQRQYTDLEDLLDTLYPAAAGAFEDAHSSDPVAWEHWTAAMNSIDDCTAAAVIGGKDIDSLLPYRFT